MSRYSVQLRNEAGQPSPVTLQRWGPLLRVEVHAPAADLRLLAAQGLPLPNPVRGWGLINTGAAKTGVLPSVAQALGLVRIGTPSLLTASGTTVVRPVHPAALRFPNLENVFAPISHVIGMEMGGAIAPDGQPVICLIGRDALANASLEYHGAAGAWAIEWREG